MWGFRLENVKRVWNAQASFDAGYAMGKEGYRWSKSPPGIGDP